MSDPGRAAGGAVIRLPDPCLVVTVGAAGSGKSTWAAAHFPPGAVVSSDRLRALVGLGEHDQRASGDAFAVLDLVVAKRLGRRLTTVIDSTALEAERRLAYVAAGGRAGVPVVAVRFFTDPEECRRRNRRRQHPVPEAVLTHQLAAAAALDEDALAAEGFAAVHAPGPVAAEPPAAGRPAP